MTPDLAIGFIAGALIASLIWIVFGAVKYNEVWSDNQLLLRTAKRDKDYIDHLKQAADPRAWLDSEDVAVNIKGREKMYDRYPELVRPGTEIIKLDVEGDIPPVVPNEGRST